MLDEYRQACYAFILLMDDVRLSASESRATRLILPIVTLFCTQCLRMQTMHKEPSSQYGAWKPIFLDGEVERLSNVHCRNLTLPANVNAPAIKYVFDIMNEAAIAGNWPSSAGPQI